MRPSGNGWVGLLRHQRSVRLGRARMSSLALSACSLSLAADLGVVVVGTLPAAFCKPSPASPASPFCGRPPNPPTPSSGWGLGEKGLLVAEVV